VAHSTWRRGNYQVRRITTSRDAALGTKRLDVINIRRNTEGRTINGRTIRGPFSLLRTSGGDD
jgi:hypothetical protein